MRNTLVTMVLATMLIGAAVMGRPTAAQSQVIVIVGNGQAYYPQPYAYPQPYPYPHPYPYSYPYHHHIVYGGYPAYGYYSLPYPYPYHDPVVYGGYPEYGSYNGGDYDEPY